MKKTILTLSAFLLGIVLTAGPLAASDYGSESKTMMQEEHQAGAMMQTPTMEQSESSKKFVGKMVNGEQGEEIGKISKLIFDSASGQIGYAVVSSAEMGGEHYIVPWNALHEDMQTENFTLNISKDKLKEAPQGESVADRKEGMKIHEFYGVSPYWEEGGMEHGKMMKEKENMMENESMDQQERMAPHESDLEKNE